MPHILIIGSVQAPKSHRNEAPSLTTIRAGVIGLQTANTLLDAGHKVTILAKHWPGDESIEYTSPWSVT
jgi:D-amino-acid oxidase